MMTIYMSAKGYPELSGVPESYRIPVAIRCHRHFAQSRWNLLFERVFFTSTIIAVLLGAFVGLMLGRLLLMVGAMVAMLMLQMLAFAVVSQTVARRRLRSYMLTEEYRYFLRQHGLD